MHCPPSTQMCAYIMIFLNTRSFAAVGLLCWPASLPGLGQLMKHLLVGDMILGDIILRRFVHCLRRYRDTRHAFPHLTNAGTSRLSS